MNRSPLIISIDELPRDREWLNIQPRPVIAYGSDSDQVNTEKTDVSADVVVPTSDEAEKLAQRILAKPVSALTLVQVLRASEKLSVAQSLDLESMAYATLQSGSEFYSWLKAYKAESSGSNEEQSAGSDEGEPILLSREGSEVEAVLNRASSRNAITVEMRDALVETLGLLAADESISSMSVRANGACFSVGGELREFGTVPDAATAHWVRSVHSPARLWAGLGARVTCYVHGACIGSGIELPAFAQCIVADRKTFFQLPELEMGLIPGAGGTVSIRQRIGRLRMAWLVLSGRRINAKTALKWGLIDKIAETSG